MAAITGEPAYRQVADDLRTKIRTGQYEAGAALPSTRRLMETYEVSITVVRAAVNQLRLEGLVLGQPGKGVFVTDAPPSAADEENDLAEVRRQMDALRTELLRLNERIADLERRVGD